MKTDETPDSDQHDDIIRNDDTLKRRAWVDRAVEGAKRRLENGEEIPAVPDTPERPRLAVVPSGRKR
jgi:hypothetical protein